MILFFSKFWTTDANIAVCMQSAYLLGADERGRGGGGKSDLLEKFTVQLVLRSLAVDIFTFSSWESSQEGGYITIY